MTASAVAERLLRVWRVTGCYLELAGRACCAGRAQVYLRRSVARALEEEQRRSETAKEVSRDP